MKSLNISDLRLIELNLDEVGPFRQGIQTFSFLAPAYDSAGEPTGKAPSNFYMLLAKNGYGKTTVLESIHGLFGLLSSPPTGRFADPGQSGRAQLDVRATWTIEGATETVLLSLWIGSETPIRNWTEAELEEQAQASVWVKIGFYHSRSGPIPYPLDEVGKIFIEHLRNASGTPPSALRGQSQDMPTVIYFPADRSLTTPVGPRAVQKPENWGYSVAQRFGRDGPAWETSLDNLLVWLEWVNKENLAELRELVRGHLFPDHSDKEILAPRKDDLSTYIDTRTGQHPLAELSHGERALLQLYVRIYSHMTRNTIILIDEIEIHLHTKWMHRMFKTLKSLLRETPSLTIIFSTHDRELIKGFEHNIPEEGLVKGGFLIDEEMV